MMIRNVLASWLHFESAAARPLHGDRFTATASCRAHSVRII
jgi:hypothetical protein